MRFLYAAVVLGLLAHPADAQELTIERLVGSPSLDGPTVDGIRISPDGQRVTFLRGKETDFRQQDLWEYHIPSGQTRLLVDSVDLLGGAEEELDEVEKARRERQRISGTGIIEYSYSPDGSALLFPLGGDLYYLKIGEAPRRLTDTNPTETDARISPMGNYVSFIRNQNLYVIDLASGAERQLTDEGGGTTLMAMAEFVAQEELDRDTGYWWAPDETRIALTRVDETPVDLVNRYEIGAGGGVTTIAQRYPFAGTENVLIDLGVVPVEGGDITWIDLGPEEDIYLPRVGWLPDSQTLSFQRQSRDQKTLELMFADAVTGESRVVLTETSETWINLTHDLRFLEDGDFIWSSERTGYRHLYRYDADGSLVGALTAGNWAVAELSEIDPRSKTVYFEGFRKGSIERHLYRADLTPNPDSITRLTEEEGWHQATVSQNSAVFVDNYSSPSAPPKVILKDMDGNAITEIESNRLEEGHPYWPYWTGHAHRRFGNLEAADGTVMDYSLRLPPDFDPEKTYPAIVNVYGGPGAQRVAKRWDLDFDQILARRGYVVFKLDNRGATNRGKKFEDVLYRQMGVTEVADQLKGARMLASLPYVDESRIGVYGHSYGGYMTIMLLAKGADLFAAGVAGAPVTDWRLYDTHYTERYLGDPAQGTVYRDSSLFRWLDGLEDPLLLMHGMADDNVFFDHSVKLMAELQERGVRFDLMTYPGKRHGLRGEATQRHVLNMRLDFFNAHLSPE